MSVPLSRKKGFQSACGGSPLLLRRAANGCFSSACLVSLWKFLSSLWALSPFLKSICLFTLQKTFSQPAQNRDCPKQLHFIVFFSYRCHLKGFLHHFRGTPCATRFAGLVKDLLFFLRIMFQIVFYFCHILFSYPNQYSQSACRFYMPQLVNLFFYCFCHGHQELFFSLLPINYVCLRVAEVIIGHSEELCKIFTCFVT